MKKFNCSESKSVIKSCPCLYLDEPCSEYCTCLHPFSSRGCLNCCTYGSLEQRKEQAVILNESRLHYMTKNNNE